MLEEEQQETNWSHVGLEIVSDCHEDDEGHDGPSHVLPLQTGFYKSHKVEDAKNHFLYSHHIVDKNLSLKLVHSFHVNLLLRVQSHVGGLERIPE